MLKTALSLVMLCGLASAALADGSCKSVAADKKLAGAAMNSFMKKCQNDARTTCDTTAASKKLAGAAKTSFTKKCVNDATGT
ncbi:hypothetical protein LGH83_02850 [Lichenihabitans sp. PAMC28606]|uniref:hypothetical protein n=1 Tax=Lichenihabitans sp. PAMC28606 TaxID=2880932 RepID=UPI001D0A3A6C|nr:hypothetical protein [Lichenihabitans sp. PAMC28606]UDL95192.1 hypothetical protein LGH83_02850 [Lichenihabitans sp. PAMC28606]